MKFKAKIKGSQLVVKVKTSSDEIVDDKELDRFERMFLRGFLRPNRTKKKQIEYTGPVGISLFGRLKKPITKRDFLFIMEQIVVAVQNLQANQMPLHHLIMNIQNVYINEATREVQFIYLPPTTGMSNSNLIVFIKSIVYSVKPVQDQDSAFASRFTSFFNSIKPFDIGKVERFIAKEDRSVVNIIRKQNVSQSGFMTNKKQHYYEHYDRKKAASDWEEKTDLLVDEDATGLLSDEVSELSVEEDDATGLLNEMDEATGLLTDEEATGLLNEDDNETGLLIDANTESTALLTENQPKVHYPTLFRTLTAETIYINKPVYRLGKERSYVDYFITNNSVISRSHADIITRNGRYYIKDLNSKNHTYINNQKLPVHCEIEIHNGDRLKLANEEFIFSA